MLMEPIEEQGQSIYRWQFFKVVDSSGVVLDDATTNPPKTFREFVEGRPFRGLGERLEDIILLLEDDTDASRRLYDLTVGKHGGDRKSEEIKNNNIILDSDMFTPPEPETTKPTQGNSRAYTLSRLHNERPDLYEAVWEPSI